MKPISTSNDESRFHEPDVKTKKPLSKWVLAGVIAALFLLLAFFVISKKPPKTVADSPLAVSGTGATVPVPASDKENSLALPVPVAKVTSAAASAAAADPSAADKSTSRLDPAGAETPPAALANVLVHLSEISNRLEHQEQLIGELATRVETLRADLDRVTAARSVANAPVTASPRPTRTATSPQTVPKTDASVLAVDMWGGKPSVAVGKAGGNGTELRFLNEGETQGAVTLKRAEVGSQRATFSTPGGELTLTPPAR